jgi:hypothetical protein
VIDTDQYLEPTGLDVLDSDGLRVVFVNGTQVYAIDAADKTHRRYVAVQLYLNHEFTQEQIASKWGVSRRIVNRWVAAFNEDGLDGLKDKGVGRPRKVDQHKERRILQLRAEKLKITEIARRVSLGTTTVKRVLRAARQQQDNLPGFEESSRKVEARENAEGVPSSGSVAEVDPLDRGADRAAAAAGLIEDAEPVFADCDHVEGAGALLAVAVLAETSFFDTAKRVYGSLGAAFYGLRSVFMTLFLMSVLRIKTPERLNEQHPLKVGRLLGLDRSPAVKTLRSKLRALANREQAANMMNLMAVERLQEAGLPDAFLLVDGHVQCYYGGNKVGQVYATGKSRVVKGATDYWVNLPDGTPLLCMSTPFNARLSKILPDILETAQKLCGDRRITLVFDRGGADAATYEKLLRRDCDLIAYHKTPLPVDLDNFVQAATVINNREYDYEPYERETELTVYRTDSKGQRRKTKRTVQLREIVVRRKDNGTTHVVTSRRDLDATRVCGILFGRWTQENFFKYMLSTYKLDHLYTYQTSDVPEEIDHPNPEYTQLEKQQRKIRRRIAAILGRKLDDIAENNLQELAKVHTGKKGKELANLSETLKGVQKAMGTTPKRISASDYAVLESETRMIGNIVKSTAWHIEGILAKLVRNLWNGVNGNERGIVEAFLQTTGSLTVDDSCLKIVLQQQSTPERTRLLQHICNEATVMAATYPGTNLRMIFDVAG